MTLSILYLPTVITTSQMSVFGTDCAFFAGILNRYGKNKSIRLPNFPVTQQK